MKTNESIHQSIQHHVKNLQRFTDRIWYTPLISFLAAVDIFILVVPTDGLLISSTMLKPKRWWFLAIMMAIGSTIGTVAFAAIVELKGLDWVLSIYPGINESWIWEWSLGFFEKFGLALVFLFALAPFVMQPIIVMAALASAPLLPLTASILAGRLLKYLLLGYLSTHAPQVLGKMWGIQGELKDVGIKGKSDV